MDALAALISPGIDPADLALVMAAWERDQPQTLALARQASAALGDDPASQAAIALVQQARYGNPSGRPPDQVASWTDLGFSTEPMDGGGWPAFGDSEPRSLPLDQAAEGYDVVVIGSGCGSVVANLAAQAGASVLIIEAGQWLAAEHPDALRNQRVGTGLATPAGPPIEGWSRQLEDGTVIPPTDGRWSNNAFTLGGGLRVFGAQAWRFSPLDFAMASHYGVPEGSALADWPIGYDDLAPYYSAVEQALGVSGDRAGNQHAGTDGPYPMPPVPLNQSGRLLREAADRLGWPTTPVPLLLNSTPYGGRPACRNCGACVGFACRAGAKNGTHNTVLPQALGTGRCELVTGARAVRLIVGRDGLITGVQVADVASGACRTIRAGRVVLAAGAIESARLLLLSAHEGEPDGLGNATDQVGRHLQAHLYPGAVGLTDEPVQEGMGPGPTVSVQQFRHDNPGIVGGGMLANDFVPLPQFTLGVLSRAGLLPRYGAGVHEGLARHYRRHIMVFGPIQEVSTAGARVRLSTTVRDGLGLPVAQLEGQLHPEDLRASDFMADRAVEWLEQAGCHQVVGLPSRPSGPSGGQHQAGTLRMGADPASSVVDPTGRVWGHPNLYVADTSVHVTNGAVNPVLTGLALAWRTGELMLRT